MGGRVHRHGGQPQDGGRHAEPPTVAPTSGIPSRPSLPLPPLPFAQQLPTGPGTGSGPATGGAVVGSRTGSRAAVGAQRTGSTAIGSRRAPGRNLRWVPIALAIWIASFLAVPAAVLVHQAVSADDTAVDSAAETYSEGDLPSGAPGSPTVAGTPARSAGSSSSTGSGTGGSGPAGTSSVAGATDGSGALITTTGAALPGQGVPASGAQTLPSGSQPSSGAIVVSVPGVGITIAASPTTASSTPPAPESPAAQDPPAEEPPAPAALPVDLSLP